MEGKVENAVIMDGGLYVYDELSKKGIFTIKD